MSVYNFADPDVVSLVRTTHRPTELPVNGPAPATPVAPVALVLVCAADREVWPCAAVVTLRATIPVTNPTPTPTPTPVPVDPFPPPRGGSGSVGGSG